VRLRVLGSNGTYPTPGRPASGFLVRGGGASLWLDAGPGTFTALQHSGDPRDVDALVLTHVHGDHCLDLFPLFNMLRFDEPSRRGIPVYLPAGAADRLAAFAGAGPDHVFFDVFDFHTVGSGDTARVGPFLLTFGETAHPVPTLAVRVEAGGRALAYSGDTGPGGDLADLAAGAAALLCEATYQGARSPDGYPYHLHAVEAGEIAARAGVARLIVTHVAPTLDPEISVAEAAEVFDGPVMWAAPGWEGDV
jgi:ribonuclease BN (tRNA processing enzyme)